MCWEKIVDIFESKICPVTGLELQTKKEWQVKHLEYECKIGVIAESIIIVEPKGNSVIDTFNLFWKSIENIINSFPDTKKFVLIDNYKNFNRASHKARKSYIKNIQKNKKIAMVIYMNLPRTLHVLVNVGITLNYLGFPVKISKNYIEAITSAIENLKDNNSLNKILKKYKPNEKNIFPQKTKVSIGIDLQEVINNKVVIGYIEKLNKYLRSINWTEYDENLHLISNIGETHPLNVLIETLSLIKFDVIQLINDFKIQENELLKTQAELKKLNKNLENIIKKRTDELLEANKKLLKVNKELKIAKEEAEKANKGKTVFLASISHELKTPLNSIMGYSSLGLSKLNTISKEKLNNYLSQINISGKRLLGLITDLIDITKFEAGAVSFNLKKENILSTAKKAISEIRPLSENKNIKINLNHSLNTLIFVFDSFRILQVFINILSNAVKFTPENSGIYINISEDENYLICSVKDEGKGLEENELKTIFEVFKMGKNSKPSSGSGLGLAISKNIIDFHKGKIWAQNSPEGGAIFTFTIDKNLKTQ
jgi:signal transduction histidine kinase